MSHKLLTSDGWTTDGPWTFGTGAVRSGGYLVCDGNPAADAYVTWDIPTVDEPASGSGRGLVIEITFIFHSISSPSGGNPNVIQMLSSGGQDINLIYLPSRQLSILGQAAPSISHATDYQMVLRYREANGGYAELWQDNVLKINIHNPSNRLNRLSSMRLGMAGGAGKITYDYKIGPPDIWVAQDPQ